MKITKELKFVLQVNSFVGMVAATNLIRMGLYTNIAWAGLIINAVCLVIWVFIKEDDENDKTDSK